MAWFGEVVMKANFVRFMLCWSLLFVGATQAQDTDLFMTNNPNQNELLPNVLIVLDNTANWSSTAGATTKFALEKAALTAVVSGLEDNELNLGIMMFSETGAGNSNPSGGYVRYAIRTMNSTNKADLLDEIGSFTINGDRGNSAEYALAMHEAYLYFQGMNARAGFNKAKRDVGAFVSATSPQYLQPSADACAKNYIIFISNGAPDNGENSTAGNLLAGLGASTSVIPLNPSTRQANWADEYARFLQTKGIYTYTFEVNPISTGQGPANTALLRSMGQQGGGEYFAVFNADELQDKLTDTFKKIQAVNSVFASTALPVSVNVRGTFLNEVYMGVFRPNADALPRWDGNLKLFQFAVDNSTGSLFLADASSPPKAAQSPVTGFINSDAVSFWTQSSDYWGFKADADYSASDSPDGNIVEKGGAAQRHRSVSPSVRKLYTCTSASCGAASGLSSQPFTVDNANLTAEMLGVSGATARAALINWVRGEDNLSERIPADGKGRPSLHGDVVHSRPAVVNYNRSGTDNDIVVFYGANDGVFRAIKGGKTAAGAGSELWGFVAPEFLPRLVRMRNNSPEVNVPSDPANPDGNKPYFADGNVSVYTVDNNADGRIISADGDKAYLYITMRRGGRFIYAFDVTIPEAPVFMWRKGCSTAGDCDEGFGELGQTWSEAKVAKINLGGVTTPVLIMGAGYDPSADDALPPGSASQGRGVFVLNALSGEIIWQVGPGPAPVDATAANFLAVPAMAYSIPADVTALDLDRNGVVDRLYAVDTGANVWRINVQDADSANWTVTHFASLGGAGASARKFLFAPDVVLSKDATGSFAALLIGSGDREHPFDESITNHFYMLKDRGSEGVGVLPVVLADLYDATDNLIQEGTDAEQSLARAAIANAKGWYIVLEPGEKVVGNALTFGGSVFFATNQPKAAQPGSCASNLGTARVYVMNFEDGSAVKDFDASGELTRADRFTEVPGGGFPPPPTGVIVEIDGKKYQTVCFGPTCEPPPDVTLDARTKTYWFKEGVD